MKQGRRAQKFILHHWWTYVSWKCRIGGKHTKVQSLVVLRGDIVNDDSLFHAVFTEQGTSTSQMTATQVMDIMSRLLGCAGQSSGRNICLYLGKNGRSSKNYRKFPNRNVQTLGFVYHDTNGQNHGPVWKTQLFLLRGICTVILLAGLLWKRQFEKNPAATRWEKVSI